MLLILFSSTHKIPTGRPKVRFSDTSKLFPLILALEKVHGSLFAFSQRKTVQAPSLHLLAACDVDMPATNYTYRLNSRWEFPCQLCSAVPENGAEQLTVGLVWFHPPTAPAAEKFQKCWQSHGLRTPPRERSAAAQSVALAAPTALPPASSCRLQGHVSGLLDPPLPEQFLIICYSFK